MFVGTVQNFSEIFHVRCELWALEVVFFSRKCTSLYFLSLLTLTFNILSHFSNFHAIWWWSPGWLSPISNGMTHIWMVIGRSRSTMTSVSLWLYCTARSQGADSGRFNRDEMEQSGSVARPV